jgi:hypothetical protein
MKSEAVIDLTVRLEYLILLKKEELLFSFHHSVINRVVEEHLDDLTTKNTRLVVVHTVRVAWVDHFLELFIHHWEGSECSDALSGE